MTAKIVCVYNNNKIFEKVVENNDSLKNCGIFAYDNTEKNMAITKHYNNFIKNNIMNNSTDKKNEDFWCAFIHQDFGFLEDASNIFKKLDPNNIYGAVGVKIFKGIFWGKIENKTGEKKIGFKTRLKLTFGRILQGDNNLGLKKHGRYGFLNPTVNTIDCCCIIIHSSLIKKYNLEFDENLNFHMYAEELCYRAKKDYKIKTKVVQMKCFHMGTGNLDEEFEKSAQYLKKKFKLKKIPSTCPN